MSGTDEVISPKLIKCSADFLTLLLTKAISMNATQSIFSRNA